MYTTDWSSLVNPDLTLDETTDLLLGAIYRLYDSSFPFKTIRIRPEDPPWMEPSLKMMIDDRDKAYSEKKWKKFYRLRSNVINHVKVLKTKYSKSVTSKNNSADIWKSIKLLGRCTKDNVRTMQFSPHDLCSYFSSNLSVPTSEEQAFMSNFDFNALPDAPLVVTPSEVEQLMKKTKKKSPGSDGIPHWVIRKYATLLSPYITKLFNRSLNECRVPASFKSGIITPIPKCPNPSSISDYRPITLLPILSKILEKIVAKHWLKPSFKDSCKDQFAYVPGPGRGTTTALTLINHHILSHLDKQSGAIRLLSVDYSKAFDKLPHPSILRAMTTDFDIPYQAVKWIMNFLSERRQQVRTDSHSPWRPVTSGVPQGSVVGPILFAMVINSLTPRHQNSKMFKYADDVTLLHFVQKSEDDRLQQEWDNITSWSRTEGLLINPTKSSVMNIITKKNLQLNNIYDYRGCVVPTKQSIKLLGLTISNDLRWNRHIQNITGKAAKRLFILRHLRKSGCSPTTIIRAYIAFIRPVLLYGYPTFCNAPSYLKKELEKTERRAIRIIGHHLENNILDTADATCSNLFRQVVKSCDHPLRDLFQARNPTPRNPCPLRPPMAKTERLRLSFVHFCSV